MNSSYDAVGLEDDIFVSVFSYTVKVNKAVINFFIHTVVSNVRIVELIISPKRNYGIHVTSFGQASKDGNVTV